MNEILKKLLDIYEASEKKDICIVGKGASVDDIHHESLKDKFVININDSECIFAGDVCVFYHDWVLSNITKLGPKCSLYITDNDIIGNIPYIKLPRISNDPENILPIQERFFDERIEIEDVVLITALKLSNWIADQLRERISVYLIGFDFSMSSGYSSKLTDEDIHDEPDYIESMLKSQETYLNFIINNKEDLSINVIHVGNKSYSKISTTEFGKCEIKREITLKTKNDFISLNQEQFKVKVVAEITTNHFGDLKLLKKMIISAKEAGADFIKLQKRDVSSFYSEEQLNKTYKSPFGNNFSDYRRGLELDHIGFNMVDKWCKEYGIGWFASVLDLPSYEYMKDFSPELIKLPSTISEHTDFLTAVANDFDKDIVLSTGMTDAKFEQFVVDTFTNCRSLYLMQCVSSYPTKKEDANVAVVRHYHDLSKKYPKIIPGYSSHDIGSLCSILAVASGARIIEKHVKYGNTAWAHFDNVAIDMLTENFKIFVNDIRKAEICLGDGAKRVLTSEHHKYFKSN